MLRSVFTKRKSRQFYVFLPYVLQFLGEHHVISAISYHQLVYVHYFIRSLLKVNANKIINSYLNPNTGVVIHPRVWAIMFMN